MSKVTLLHVLKQRSSLSIVNSLQFQFPEDIFESIYRKPYIPRSELALGVP